MALQGFCDVCYTDEINNVVYFFDLAKTCKSCDSSDRVRALIIVSFATVFFISYATYVIKEKMRSKKNLNTVFLKLFTQIIFK